MTTKLSLADTWEARGEARGEAIGQALGEAIGQALGEAIGQKNKARLTVLRGHFRWQATDMLSDLCGLSVEEVLVLKKDYDTVKKAWADKKIDMSNLTNHTTLSEREIISIITCLDNPI